MTRRGIDLWLLWPLLILILLLWARGYIRRDQVRYTRTTGQACQGFGINSFNGGLFFDYGHAPLSYINFPIPDGFTVYSTPVTDPSFVIRWSHAGFFAFSAETYPNRRGGPWYAQAGVPYWFLAALCVIAIVWRHRRHRAIRLAMADRLCARCGYDLRASAERCPECGEVIAPGVVDSELARGGVAAAGLQPADRPRAKAPRLRRGGSFAVDRCAPRDGLRLQ